MKKQVNLSLIGFGVVGSGTLQLLNKHRKDIESRVGAKLNVVWVCSRHRKKTHLIGKKARQTQHWKEAVTDPQVDLVVELVGGVHPAKQIVTTALRSGKHVVTANKAILANHWDEIFALARKKERLVYFEASVGAGVPVIQALNEGLAGNRIHKIIGILNGTTNFILTQMQEVGLTFEQALREAQRLGFAEADPSFDIKGVDAAQKIAILGSLAIGKWVRPKQVYCEGISHVHPMDIRLIRSLFHSQIKLLGIAEKLRTGWTFRVHPTLIPESHPFANVRNEYNAISLFGDAVDDVMIYGKGAGKLPTSSAVVSDIIFLSRQIANETAGDIPYVAPRSNGSAKFVSHAQTQCRYYIRVSTQDHPGVLSRITGILGRHGVSIDSVHQDAYENETRGIPIILLTHKSRESNVQAAVHSIDKLPSTLSKSILLRML